jgi:hypothetical protein
MVRESEWTKPEFILLLNNSELSNEELSRLLPKRGKGAIGVVRAGVHSYHIGGDISMLSNMMKGVLTSQVNRINCSKCKVAF